MRKESKILSVQSNGTYQPNGGDLLFKFEYQFEDGTCLVANHKTEQCPFNIGDTAEYEVRGSNHKGTWGAVRKAGQSNYTPSNGNTTGERIDRSWAIKTAVQSLGPMPRPGSAESVKVYMREVCRMADVLTKARDTFPKFEADDIVRAYWDSLMADDNDLPF